MNSAENGNFVPSTTRTRVTSLIRTPGTHMKCTAPGETSGNGFFRFNLQHYFPFSFLLLLLLVITLRVWPTFQAMLITFVQKLSAQIIYSTKIQTKWHVFRLWAWQSFAYQHPAVDNIDNDTATIVFVIKITNKMFNLA